MNWIEVRRKSSLSSYVVAILLLLLTTGCSGAYNSGIKVLSDKSYGCNKLLSGLYTANGYPSDNPEESLRQLNSDMVECWSVTYRSIKGENADPKAAWRW